MTERYAVIGHPVAHSKSPQIHAEFARATGQDIEYRRIEAPLDGFRRAADEFRAAGGKGLNVTLPFKQEAFRYCGEASARARVAEAVNTLAFGAPLFGDNTDGVGLVRDLGTNLHFDLQSSRALVLGAGGAAQGIVGALREAGVAQLVIANRTVEKAQALAARFSGTRGCGFEALGEESFGLIVNATSASLVDAAPPLPASAFGRAALAYDMVYGRDTPFLAAARAAGARVSDGLGMLVEQAAESFFVWRGVRPDTAPVLRKLRGG
jgi:shikimate dehydrogenase